MMRANNYTKVSPPPPVPPRPSKTVVAEALAKSRKISPARVLYATQPLSASEIRNEDVDRRVSLNSVNKPVVPVRTAPPPPVAKPRPANIPNLMKSASSAAVLVTKPSVDQQEISKVSRSISDCRDLLVNNATKMTRTVVYQSNLKTISKIEVNLNRNSSFNKSSMESTKNEKNNKECEKITSNTDDKNKINAGYKMSNASTHCLLRNNEKQDKGNDKAKLEDISNMSVDNKSSLEFCSNSNDDTNNNVCQKIIKTDSVRVANDDAIETVEKIIDKIEKLEPVFEKRVVETIDEKQKLETIDEQQKKLEIIDEKQKLEKINEKKKMLETIDEKQNLETNDEKQKTVVVVEARNQTMTSAENNCDSPQTVTGEKKPKSVKFDDKVNHEILIEELENMRKEQERLSKRQRKPCKDIYDTDDEFNSRIHHSDWVEVADGEEVRLSSCQIYIDDDDDGGGDDEECQGHFTSRFPRNMSLHGLPPLPKSLSGFNLLDNGHRSDSRGTCRVPASPGPQTPSRASSSRGTTPPTPGSGSGHVVYPPHPRMNGTTPSQRKPTNLDTQLAILRREMYGLRQLDLTLLSQLYSLNEAIQDFRQMLQDQEDTVFSPHSPSPSPSSGDEIDDFYAPSAIRFKPAGPPPRRTSNSSSATSSEYGTV